MPAKYTLTDFINKARYVHGNKYIYSNVIYVRNKIKVKIKCRIHGIFDVTPDAHTNLSVGCAKCAFARNIKAWQLTKKIFVERAKKIHGNKYSYRLVAYKNINEKVKIICKKHGVFYQTPSSHTNGKSGCGKCAGLYKLDTDTFIKKAKVIHGNLYDYSKTEYGISNSDYVNIICKKHGVFSQRAGNHLNGNGCNKCRCSKGELSISRWLVLNKIPFEYQKQFDSCRNTRPLPFDFYLEYENLLIEFDGEQHFKVSRWSKDKEKMKNNLATIQNNDEKKLLWAKINGIGMLRIPYTKFKDIPDILHKKIINE